MHLGVCFSIICLSFEEFAKKTCSLVIAEAKDEIVLVARRNFFGKTRLKCFCGWNPSHFP